MIYSRWDTFILLSAITPAIRQAIEQPYADKFILARNKAHLFR